MQLCIAANLPRDLSVLRGTALHFLLATSYVLNIIRQFEAYKSSPCQWTIYSHHRRKPVNPETSRLNHHENLTTSLHTKYNKKALVKKMRKKCAVQIRRLWLNLQKRKKWLNFFLMQSTGVILLDNGSHLGWKPFSCTFCYPGLDICNMHQAKGCLKQFSIVKREIQEESQEKLRGSHQLCNMADLYWVL